MKLFAKIFLCSITVLSLALSVSGYLLIAGSFENAMERERDRAREQYQLVRFSLQSSMITSDIDWEEEKEVSRLPLFQSVYSSGNSNGLTLFGKDKALLYSTHESKVDEDVLERATETNVVSVIKEVQGRYYIVLVGKVVQGDNSVYQVIDSDITWIINQKRQMESTYKLVFGLTLAISMVIMLALAAMLTNPVKKLTRAAAKIAEGKYGERARVSTNDEIGELGNRFNYMAETIEEKVLELEKNAQQKEDFVGNFAHELKTPLTSIIGYSDMIYQKDLSPEGTKSAAGYILNEGMRLEALSQKLMDMIVLNRQDFILEEIRTEEFFEDIEHTLIPQMKEKDIQFQINIEQAILLIEYDLFKTMILNLVDNAVKAAGTKIAVSGKMCDNNVYQIRITDNGRGMPAGELERITEAFYMVDKSRSRKQHGAGLGLSLASRIAEIHKTRLQFESEPGRGTLVTIELQAREVKEDE